MSNILKNVIPYLENKVLPSLYGNTVFPSLVDTEYEEWSDITKHGGRGNKFTCKKQTRFVVKDGLVVDTANTGDFQEEFMTVVADQTKHTFWKVTADELATYPFDSKYGDEKAIAQAEEIGANIDYYLAKAATDAPFQFIGDPLVPSGNLQTYASITRAIANFRSYVGNQMIHCVLPLTDSATIISNMLGQFANDRNNKVANTGELGSINGITNVKFYQSDILPSFTAGTAADDAQNTNGYAITNVNNTTSYTDPLSGDVKNTTTLTLTATNGLTAKVGDHVQVNGPDLYYLKYVGHIPTTVPVTTKVVAADTAAGGELTVQVYPRLDATAGDVQANLPRAVNTGTDTVQFLKSHKRGVMFVKPYFKFVMPRLPNENPLMTHIVNEPETKLSLRGYYGAKPFSNLHGFVVDCMYGAGVSEEGFSLVPMPLT